MHSTIKEAIEQVTHVVMGNQPNRVVLYSANVVNRSGRRLMAVMVERVSGQGKIITATWKDSLKGPIIWDSTNGFYMDFDREVDVLYISRGPAVEAYATEDEKDGDIWYRKADEDDSPVGVTLFRAQIRERKEPGWIARIASSFLGIASEQIETRLVSVMLHGS